MFDLSLVSRGAASEHGDRSTNRQNEGQVKGGWDGDRSNIEQQTERDRSKKQGQVMGQKEGQVTSRPAPAPQ